MSVCVCPIIENLILIENETEWQLIGEWYLIYACLMHCNYQWPNQRSWGSVGEGPFDEL